MLLTEHIQFPYVFEKMVGVNAPAMDMKSSEALTAADFMLNLCSLCLRPPTIMHMP